MTTQHPEALRLADELDAVPETGADPQTIQEAAAELLRLHAENEALQAGYAAARLEIESLQDRIKTMAEEHADELLVAHLDGMRAAQPAGAQAAPAAMYSDLRARCVEVLAWRETGTLPGEALRTLAREKYGDRYDAIQRAERDTETEALNLVAAAPTTQPAGADRHGLPPLPDPDLRDVGTTPGCIKEFLRGYATEYAKAALTARAPADSVPEDAAQVEIDLFNDLNRISGNTLTAYAKEMCRLGYRKTNAAQVVVTKDEDGQIVAVTRQDDEGHILSVIATCDPAEQQAPTPQPTQAQPVAREPLTCEWTHDDDDDYWDTSCGEVWRFDDGGPKENNMNFCHCCGKTLRIKGGQHGTE